MPWLALIVLHASEIWHRASAVSRNAGRKRDERSPPPTAKDSILFAHRKETHKLRIPLLKHQRTSETRETHHTSCRVQRQHRLRITGQHKQTGTQHPSLVRGPA
ncbi:hypothetical protein BCR37DRAFT_76412 [Protomyces lactucae-debilis]|uniref:Secreted protein n=1 Tax=Protomyces lactucae-debilis TaxID=2754530 RepID=A0A1Y2F7J8_PROLT|nr:uncharacterized protein BCR37DRAFT_76412 [Protomyces lactucae-debilis]ORY79868.1 hypothetical protein BCR37DRAFT_76412 [Protomyces lactucae-debilis]